MPHEKSPELEEKDLQDLAKTHLEIGDGRTATHQQLFNYLQEEGYEIENTGHEVENFFSEKETGLKQTYELERDGKTYELHIRKEGGRMQKYWFEE